MIFEKDKSETYEHEFKAELEDNYGKDYTREDIIAHLFGDYDDWRRSSYTLYTYKVKPKQTLFNRFNLLWVYPVFLLLVFPVKWMFTGEWGYRT